VNRMYLLLGTATLMAISIANASAKDKPSEAFLKKAIEGNFAEVSMGTLRKRMAKAMPSSRSAKCFRPITPPPIRRPWMLQKGWA